MSDHTTPLSGPNRLLRRLLPRPLKRALRALATAPERATHRGRRRRALDRLRARGRLESILVLCHGNICRSPFVALRIRELRPPPDGPAATSAGFFRGGRPSPIEAQTAARRRGIDLETHRSRQVTAQDIDATDLVIVMEPEQRARVLSMVPAAEPKLLLLGELDPHAFQTAVIPDPWGHPQRVFDRCYVRLDRCVDVLIDTLG